MMTNIELETMRAVKSAAIHSTRISWDEIRCQAAVSLLPQCVATINDVLLRGGKLTEDNAAKQAAVMAVSYAKELVNELKRISDE